MREPEAPALAEPSPIVLRSSSLSSEALLDALKMILTGTSLVDVLTSIIRLIESHSNGMLCSIFLVGEDGLHLRYAAATNLPEAYRKATDGTLIGPGRGPCSMAAHSRKPVFVTDFVSDPDWTHFKEKPLSAGLLAGWSNPIIGNNGQVLGTFGMYFREPRSPSEQEIQLIDYASRIVGIAIERDITRNSLQKAFDQIQKSESELRQLIDFLPELVFVLDPKGAVLQANRTMLDYTGRTIAEMQGVGTDERMKRDLHPEDFERITRERSAGIARGLQFELETRALGKDGRYRWFLFRYNPLLKEDGRPACWFATAIEIEDRKQAELRMRDENLALREEISRSSSYEEIVGSSVPLRRVLSQIGKVAPTDSTVLILGETGTGKELIASTIHHRSKRSTRPSFESIALLFHNRWSLQNSLVMRREHSQEHSRDASAVSRLRMVERFSWMKLAIYRPIRRFLCSVCCRSVSSNASAAMSLPQ